MTSGFFIGFGLIAFLIIALVLTRLSVAYHNRREIAEKELLREMIIRKLEFNSAHFLLQALDNVDRMTPGEVRLTIDVLLGSKEAAQEFIAKVHFLGQKRKKDNNDGDF